ncbi:MAG: hypothetical protein HY399_08420 [Elusimicrobia bacterium]|nr:hypothetical protein [Elusimicrobiota bacterium]
MKAFFLFLGGMMFVGGPLGYGQGVYKLLDQVASHPDSSEAVFDGTTPQNQAPAVLLLSKEKIPPPRPVSADIQNMGRGLYRYFGIVVDCVDLGMDKTCGLIPTIASPLLPDTLEKALRMRRGSRFSSVLVLKFGQNEQKFLTTLFNVSQVPLFPQKNPMLREEDGETQNRLSPEWTEWARTEQNNVVWDSLRQAIFYRYGIDSFTQASQKYVRDYKHGDTVFWVLAPLVGAGSLYLSGMRGSAQWGAFWAEARLKSIRATLKARKEDRPLDRGLVLSAGYRNFALVTVSNYGKGPVMDAVSLRYTSHLELLGKTLWALFPAGH